MNKENIFRNIYDHIKIPIFVINVEVTGELIFSCINPAFEKATGLRKEDVIGKRTEEISGFSKESSAKLRTHCQHCLEGNEAVHFDWIFRKHGKKSWWLTQLAPLRDSAGKIVQIVGSSTNITKRKKIEQKLRARERQYRTLAENLPDLIVRYDPDLRLTYVNPTLAKLSGLSAGEVVNVPASDIPRVPNPTEDTYAAALQRVLETGVPESQKFIWINAQGELLHLEYRVIPEYDRDGNVAGLLCVGHDITEREQNENELRRSHDLLRAIIEAAPTAIIGLDLNGNVHTVWNPAAEKMLGWSAQEAIGRPLPSVPAEKQEEFRRFRESIRKGLTLNGVEVRRQKRDGTPIDYSIYASPLHDTEGSIIGNVAVLADITERKRIDNIMQARLRLLECANSHSMDELLTAALDEMEALTGSSIGFYHFLEANQKTLSLQSWSTNTLKNMCTAAGKGSHYDLAQAGVWVDCVYERRAVIHNDYASLPHRKGMSEGHTPVIRELVVPIFRGNMIKAIIGVGNKLTDYDENDVEIISQLGDLSWDIVERRQAEDALRQSEEEKTILNQIANVFLTIPDDAIYGEVLAVVLQVMKSKFGVFGYIAENGDLIIPSLTREIWNECQVPDKSMVFPPEYWGNSLWGRAIREKKAFYSDGPFHTPGGHIHIDRFITVPIIYGQGTIGQISVANKEGSYTEEDKDLLEHIASRVSPILHARLQRDIQERRRMAAEKNLKESEEKYRLLITNAGEAIFIVQDEVVKFPNPKALEMIGYSVEELAKIPFVDLIHPGDKDTIFERYLRLPEGERHPKSYPFRIIDKSGKEMWVQLTTAPIIWEKKPGILCFLGDITEEKKLEAQFIQAQKMEAVGRLAGGVAHDFNNMLTAIIGHTELTLMNVAASDPLCDHLREIDKAARRSADLIRQLLAFARKQTIAPKVLNLNNAVSSMLNIMRRLIGEDIELVWRPGTELWAVKVDTSQIDQVLANLCVNARDAIAGVGKIIVETKNIAVDEAYCASHAGFFPGEYAMLAVSDDGCGMDEETQAHLFEPFFTTKDMGKGTGLGLATVHGIVKQNDGFINVYSEPGQGTTFKIYFPRHNAELAVSLKESEAEISPGKGETVLIVEDEKAILDLGKRFLEDSGYTVLTARTPREAIRLVEEHIGDIHLLLTDVVMPEMNGQELAEQLVSINPNLECLFMSGYTANVIAHRGILEEGVHFIHKPFSMKDLIGKVRKVLDRKSD
jgi:two-component system cell cycle sensor histidine kinase/response regulator CckA